MSWTVKRGEEERSLDGWGVSGGNLRRANQSADRLTFAAGALPFDADPVFADGDTIELWRDREAAGEGWSGGARVFVGEVISIPSHASGSTEGQAYEMQNAFGVLDETLYEQQWYLVDPDHLTVLIPGRQSNVTLFQGFNGAKLTIGQQLADVVTLANERGVALQFSAVDRDALTKTPAFESGRDLMCGEVIRRCLRWVPDAVTWIDYATTPPTLRVQRRASLDVVTLPCVDPNDGSLLVEGVRIRPRSDLVSTGVALKYEVVDVIDGTPWRRLVKDVFPIGADETSRDTLIATIDLDGDQLQRSSVSIVTRPLQPATKEWWGLRDGDVNQATTADFGAGIWQAQREDGSILNQSEMVDEGLVNELVSGQIADWMLREEGAAAETLRIFAYANLTADLNISPLPAATRTQIGRTLQTRVTCTSLTSGTYTTTELLSQGEDVPVGLAEQLYEAVSVLHYEGNLSLVAQECPAVPFGRLNLTGGRAEWSTMSALIQTLDLDIDSGRTTVGFGPPSHLGPADLVELLRFNRQRRVTMGFSSRTTGRDSRGEAGALGKLTANHDTAAAVVGAVNSDLFAHSPEDDRKVWLPANGLRTVEEGAHTGMATWMDAVIEIGGVPTHVRIPAQPYTP